MIHVLFYSADHTCYRWVLSEVTSHWRVGLQTDRQECQVTPESGFMALSACPQPLFAFCLQTHDVIIRAMSAHTLHFNLPDAERPSIWPWLLALLAGACLVVVVAQKLQSIPANLQSLAAEQLADAGFDTVAIEVNGRDVSLVGSIEKRTSIAPLLAQLENLEGVRIVRDQLLRFDAVEVEAQNTQLFLQTLSRIDLSTVAFQAGSNSIASDSAEALDQVAQLLQGNADKRIRIEGQTDDTGPASVNLRLSQERAQAVARYLESRNVSADQLIAKGYGSTQPIADNATESGRASNRRIEISYVD